MFRPRAWIDGTHSVFLFSLACCETRAVQSQPQYMGDVYLLLGPSKLRRCLAGHMQAGIVGERRQDSQGRTTEVASKRRIWGEHSHCRTWATLDRHRRALTSSFFRQNTADWKRRLVLRLAVACCMSPVVSRLLPTACRVPPAAFHRSVD